MSGCTAHPHRTRGSRHGWARRLHDGRMPDRRLQTALALVVALTVSAAARVPNVQDDTALPRRGAPADSCPLCHLPATMPILRLHDADIDSLGAALAVANELELARVDSLYRNGV